MIMHATIQKYTQTHMSYHHRKDYGGSGSFDDPEKHQAAELDDGEQVNFSQRDVSQVDKIRLVFCRHPKQPHTIKKLNDKHEHTVRTVQYDPVFGHNLVLLTKAKTKTIKKLFSLIEMRLK